MVLGEPDPYYGPQEVAEDKAFLGIGAVLDFLGGQSLPLVGGKVGGGGAAPEVLGNDAKIIVILENPTTGIPASIIKLAVYKRPTTWSIPTLDLNFAYRISLEISRYILL